MSRPYDPVYQAAWRARHRERLAERARAWRENNPERAAEIAAKARRKRGHAEQGSEEHLERVREAGRKGGLAAASVHDGEHYVAIGRRGGYSTARRHPDHHAEIGRRGAENRARNLKLGRHAVRSGS